MFAAPLEYVPAAHGVHATFALPEEKVPGPHDPHAVLDPLGE